MKNNHPYYTAPAETLWNMTYLLYFKLEDATAVYVNIIAHIDELGNKLNTNHVCITIVRKRCK